MANPNANSAPAIISKKTRRGYGRKKSANLRNSRVVKLSLLGNNSAGLNPKRESFYNLVNKFKPSLITLQETKLVYYGTAELPGYKVFESLRKDRSGGGLYTAVLCDLDPVLISESENNDLLVVQFIVNGRQIRIFNAYGPQEHESSQQVLNFWQTVESEIIQAKQNHCLIIMQMDANAKLGKKFIEKDPHDTSNNGVILADFNYTSWDVCCQ